MYHLNFFYYCVKEILTAVSLAKNSLTSRLFSTNYDSCVLVDLCRAKIFLAKFHVTMGMPLIKNVMGSFIKYVSFFLVSNSVRT